MFLQLFPAPAEPGLGGGRVEPHLLRRPGHRLAVVVVPDEELPVRPLQLSQGPPDQLRLLPLLQQALGAVLRQTEHVLLQCQDLPAGPQAVQRPVPGHLSQPAPDLLRAQRLPVLPGRQEHVRCQLLPVLGPAGQHPGGHRGHIGGIAAHQLLQPPGVPPAQGPPHLLFLNGCHILSLKRVSPL